MNKKVNAAIFILIAIVFNLVIFIGIMILVIIILNKIAGKNPDPSATMFFPVLVMVIPSAGTLLIHFLVLRFVIEKTRLEKYLPERMYRKKQK